jgi:hypothetical protein
MVRFGHGTMSELRPLLGVKLKPDFGTVRAAFDPSATSTSMRIAVAKLVSAPINALV